MKNSNSGFNKTRSRGDVYKVPVNVNQYDVKMLYSFMEVELKFYNQIVDIFGAQLQRNHLVFLELEPEHIELYGALCSNPYDIYNLKIKLLPDHLQQFADTISKMSRQTRFLFTEQIKKSSLESNVKRRMGMSLLRFYIEQAIVKERNQYVNGDGDLAIRTIYNNLTSLQIFNKKHLQIDRDQCIIKYNNNKEDNTLIYTPYTKRPLVINDFRIVDNKWNLMILKQEDKISTLNGEWVADFKKVDDSFYLVSQVDRLGKQSIFETTRQKI